MSEWNIEEAAGKLVIWGEQILPKLKQGRNKFLLVRKKLKDAFPALTEKEAEEEIEKALKKYKAEIAQKITEGI